VLAALNPYWAANFLANGGLSGFLVLGSVFLVVTGGEALYANIGHFGTRPIRVTWFWVVMPAPVLNYFGQARTFWTIQKRFNIRSFTWSPPGVCTR
jgi:KUP system potassium uptake protein